MLFLNFISFVGLSSYLTGDTVLLHLDQLFLLHHPVHYTQLNPSPTQTYLSLHIKYLSLLYDFSQNRYASINYTLRYKISLDLSTVSRVLNQCFSTAGPRPATGPWHQLYRAARGSPAICHFSFLSSFHE